MEIITGNEMETLLLLLKDFDADYNANNLSKKLGITPMGALKILKKMERQKLLNAKQMGKAVFYKPDLDSNYTKTFLEFLEFLLQKKAEETKSRVKRWVKELRTLQNNAEIGILFGSVLEKESYNDVDLLIVLKQSQNSKINLLINEIRRINIKRIHVIKQTKEDLKQNIKKGDKVVLNAIKNGMVFFGYEKIIKVIQDVTR